MKVVKNAKFITSVSDAKQYKSYNLPEIAVVGRSNVGKSSFINMLANNKKLAKTSSTPGRTRLVNFFEFELKTEQNNTNKFMLVDLPGYGYAKAGASEQNRWKGMIDGYLDKTVNLKMVLLLLDIRHEPSIQDLQMFDYLFKKNIATTVVTTKADKVPKSQLKKYATIIGASLKIGVGNIYITSSENALGREQVIERLWQFASGGNNESLGD